jgi:branched-chain amino acid transport system ATP-binding protein
VILTAKGLCAGYGRAEMIHGVDLNIARGEIVCLIGANGAGKTTILRAISGIIKIKKGSISFDEIDITNFKSNRLVGMGLGHVPEGRQIFNDLTVRQNLILGAYAIKKKSPETESILKEVFDLFPMLRERLDKKAGSLSGGGQQMLAIGRGMMSKPKLLLLDEPSMGLAPLLVESILDTIEKLRSNGISILLVEQNVGSALAVADRAYVIENGRIVTSGKSSELRDDEKVKESYLGI